MSSFAKLTFNCAVHLHVQESIDFSPSSPACRSVTRPLGWAETKQTHLALCVAIQAPFKTKDLCLAGPTNNIRIRLVEPDQGATLPLRAFLCTAPSSMPSLSFEKYLSNHSIKPSIKIAITFPPMFSPIKPGYSSFCDVCVHTQPSGFFKNHLVFISSRKEKRSERHRETWIHGDEIQASFTQSLAIWLTGALPLFELVCSLALLRV